MIALAIHRHIKIPVDDMTAQGFYRSHFWMLAALSVSAGLSAAEPVKFGRDIRPILAGHCYSCHGFDPQHREAGLRLDTFDGATTDNNGTRAIVPGDPAHSELWSRINDPDPDVIMPPPKSHKPALTPHQLRLIQRWIAEGADYEPHWAFVAPRRPDVVGDGSTAIDQLVDERLHEAGLSRSPRAKPETLLRRVTLDLTGLPPTLEELDTFLSAVETDPEAAYAAAVERLLASPHYGERWGRWWLDQARYADSNGYSIDAPRVIWKYRDWVVQALNQDLPFDQFTIEQLAGDLLPEATEGQVIATGFHRNTQINQEGGIDHEQFRIESVFDRVATTGTVWLGLSIGCAQCHDHKFDPVTQKEYYQLFAFLNNQNEPQLTLYEPDVNVPALKLELQTLRKSLEDHLINQDTLRLAWEANLTSELRKKIPVEVIHALDASQEKRSFSQQLTIFAYACSDDQAFQELNKHYANVQAALNSGVTTLVLQELPKPRRTTVFIKGDFTRPADEVIPGTPVMLHPLEKTTEQPNRLNLAHWLVSPQNPLTSRVIVNRLWLQYFGRGLVETDSDFGLQGMPPSHPELLDWLATEFLERDWSLKAMHRLIVSSQTYQQSSDETPFLREQDPLNLLLGRQRRLRLDAELVRDAALSTSGLLSTRLGGPPVFPPIPDGVMSLGQVRRKWTVSQGEDRYRRGLYTFVYRATPPPSLSVFDAPDGITTCTHRLRSNTPLQSLTLLNDASFVECALELEKIIHLDGLAVAFRRATSRPINPTELAVLNQLDTLSAARTILNLDETVTRE